MKQISFYKRTSSELPFMKIENVNHIVIFTSGNIFVSDIYGNETIVEKSDYGYINIF